MESAVGIIIVSSLVILALSGNKRAQTSLKFLFWAFIALVVALTVGIAVSVW